MSKQSRIPSVFSAAFVALSIIYLGLVLVYQSPRPVDLLRFITNNALIVDSAVVLRVQPVGKLYPRNLDSLRHWYYRVELVGHSNVQAFVTVDSAVILHQLNGPFLGRLLFNPIQIEPEKPFVIREIIEGRRFSKEPDSDTTSVAGGFRDHSMHLVLYTSRGRYQLELQYYMTPEHLGMMRL